MAENPYVGAAEGFAGSAASNMGASLRYLQGLRDAAAQQQKLQDQQRSESFKNTLEIISKGGVPADMPATGGKVTNPNAGPGQSSGQLGRRNTPNPDAPTDGSAITEPISGTRYVIPKKKEGEEKLDDSNSFVPQGDLADRLKSAGVTGRVPYAHMGTLLEGLNKMEASPKVDVWHTTDSEGKVHVFKSDKSTGETNEVYTEPGAGKGTKPTTPKSYQFSYHTDDNGTVHVLRGDPESGEVQEIQAIKGAGPKRKDPDAADKPKPPSPAQLRAVTETKGRGLAKAEADYRKELETAITPEDKATAKANLDKAKQATQQEYEESLGALVGHDVGHFQYSDQATTPSREQTGATAPATPAKAAQPKQAPKPAGSTGQAAAPKRTTIGTVQRYAKKNGLTIKEAVKRAEAEGFTIGAQ